MDDLQDMIDRINELKKTQNKTSKDISEESGIPLGTLNKILSGISKEPTMQSGRKIAQSLGVSIDYLMFGKEPNQKIQNFHAPDEKELLGYYRQLNDLGKSRVLEDVEEKTKMEKYTSRGGAKKKA